MSHLFLKHVWEREPKKELPCLIKTTLFLRKRLSVRPSCFARTSWRNSSIFLLPAGRAGGKGTRTSSFLCWWAGQTVMVGDSGMGICGPATTTHHVTPHHCLAHCMAAGAQASVASGGRGLEKEANHAFLALACLQ